MRRGQNSFFEKRFSFFTALHMRWNIPYPSAKRKAENPIIAIAFDIMKLLFGNMKSQVVEDLAFAGQIFYCSLSRSRLMK
jgi:hypothetical protein